MFMKRAGTMFIFSIMLLLLIPVVAPSSSEKQSDALRWFLSPPGNRSLPSMEDNYKLKSDVCGEEGAVSMPTYTMAGQTSMSSGPMNSSWPMYCHDARHTSRSPYSTANNPYVEKWRFSTINHLWISTSMTISNDGTIYFAQPNYMYALYPNGILKWKFGTGDATETAPAIAQDGTIYIGSSSGKIFGINPLGTENWNFQTGNEVLSSPVIDKNGIIYCGSLDGNLYVLNPNGTLRWTFDAGDSIESSTAIGEDGTIYIAGQFEPGGGQESHTYLYALQIINDQPPSIPAINGPPSGKAKQNYNYTIVSTDPEGNNISYYVNWGDGTNTGWIGPFNSGYERTVNHTWNKRGTYTIKAKAKDNYSAESGWGTLQVKMPLSNNAMYSLWLQFLERFFERHPHAFPLLRHLLGQ